jgi:two-component system response regulator AtoC
MQVKMNRVLQERQVRRLGDTEEHDVDVRFVAASNKNFDEEIRAGRFREDLFFRLNVLDVNLPPLRERSRDVVHLAEWFVQRFASREGKVIEGISPEALKALMAYSWPGNVRELENTIERAVLLARGTVLTPEDLPAEIPTLTGRRGLLRPNTSLPYHDAMKRLYQDASQSYIEEVLARFDGNVTQAARFAGIPRESLHRMLRGFGIRAADLRRGRDTE